MEQVKNFYVWLLLLVSVGLGFCVWLRPEVFTLGNIICWLYAGVAFSFFSFNLRDDYEDTAVRSSFFLSLFGIEIGILLGLDFWVLPLVAALVVSVYFLTKAAIYKQSLHYRELFKNFLWLSVYSYVLILAIQYVIVAIVVAIWNFLIY